LPVWPLTDELGLIPQDTNISDNTQIVRGHTRLLPGTRERIQGSTHAGLPRAKRLRIEERSASQAAGFQIRDGSLVDETGFVADSIIQFSLLTWRERLDQRDSSQRRRGHHSFCTV